MKRMKKTVSVFLTVLIGLLTLQTGMAVFSADSFFDYGDYRFAVNDDDTLSVAGYYGTQTSLSLPERVEARAVTGIHSRCFQNSAVESVVIPEGYTKVDAFAFNGCASLRTVKLPSTLKTIGMLAFYQCTALQDPDLSATALESVGMFAFSGCSSLTNIALPDSVSKLGNSAFSSCGRLERLSLPAGLTAIGAYAFANDPALAFVDLPLSLQTIGEGAFENDTAPDGVFIPESVTGIGADAFAPMQESIDFAVFCFSNTAAESYFTENATVNLTHHERIIGDVNFDGKLDIADATFIQMDLAGYDVIRTSVIREMADVNGDGSVNITDVTAIQRILAELPV